MYDYEIEVIGFALGQARGPADSMSTAEHRLPPRADLAHRLPKSNDPGL